MAPGAIGSSLPMAAGARVVETAAPVVAAPAAKAQVEAEALLECTVSQTQADAPPCHFCGSIMVRSGSCYKCFNCGGTSGCS